MRKVKNNIQVSNTSDLFAKAVANLSSDPLFNPSQTDFEELETMKRSARKPASQGNLFNGLLRQFSNL